MLFISLIGFIAWYVQDTKPLSVLVIDKTVPYKDFQEHRTFMMILKNQNWVKTNGEFYDLEKDYVGFFLIKNQQSYLMTLKDMMLSS
jgi:hypothetical protein